MTNYLFICRLNARRSKKCAKVFSSLLKQENVEGKVKSAGMWADSDSYDGRQVSRKLCSGADRIFVMEEWMAAELIKDHQADKDKIINLDILDVYKGGRFAQEGLDWTLDCEWYRGREDEIRDRPEIQGKWDLIMVIQARNLGQYIL